MHQYMMVQPLMPKAPARRSLCATSHRPDAIVHAAAETTSLASSPALQTAVSTRHKLCRPRTRWVAASSTAPPVAPAPAATDKGATAKSAAAHQAPKEGASEPMHAGDAPPPQVLAGKTVGIVGGGPGGLVCAANLARLGAAVEVFERHDPAMAKGPPPAVWPLALGDTGRRAIEASGLSPEFAPKWRYEGAAGHRVSQPAAFMGDWVNERMPGNMYVLASQYAVVEHLRGECERVYGAAIRVHYGMRAVGGDVCGGEVVLETSAGERVARQFDMLVGADGANSAVRGLMQEKDPHLSVKVSRSPSGMVCADVTSPGQPSTYSSLETPSGVTFRAVPEGLDRPLKGSVLTFVAPGEGGHPALELAIPTYWGGGEGVTMSLRADVRWLTDLKAHSEADLADALARSFPHMPRLWIQETAACLHSEAADGSLKVRELSFVTCSKLASGRAVLLGDAAHAVSPNLGMGCNAAMQDSKVLAQACIAAGGDVCAAAEEYSGTRLANAQTLAHVSRSLDTVMGFKYTRDKLGLLMALPYSLPNIVTMMVQRKKLKLPGFLLPGFSVIGIIRDTDDWAKVHGKVWGYTAKLLAVAVGALAAVTAVVWKVASVLMGGYA